MGKLTTHILDTTHGVPGHGIGIELYRINGEHREHLKSAITNDDGRCDEPLLAGGELSSGTYELVFAAGTWFAAFERAAGSAIAEPSQPRFLDDVVIRFGVADVDQHYHVPLLISPFSYSTYRGS